MEKAALAKKKLPDTPGVYFFLGKNKKILYIGKATSLRSRVRSYFDPTISEKRSELIAQMVLEAKSIDFRKTESVLEALILEANLIRHWKPRYNTEGKDDKSWNYVVITNEEFPRVLLVRGNEIYQQFEEKELRKVFGPFPHGAQLFLALQLIRRIFPFFDTKKPVTDITSKQGKGVLAFNQQIGIYPAFSRSKYLQTIRHITLLFEGKKPALIAELKREMKDAVKREEFEKAEQAKRQIFALTHIRDISLIKEDVDRNIGNFKIEAYDVAHLGGSAMVGVMVVVEDGVARKSDYRKFKIKTVQGANDTKSLQEILERRFTHEEWTLPKLIVVDGSKAQINAAQKVLNDHGYQIPIIGVVKDEHHRPRDILGDKKHIAGNEQAILLANAEAHRFAIAYHKRLRGGAFDSRR